MRREHDRFDAFELSIVLSHFDIGTIESIKEFRRGSRRSPKLLLRTDRGRYLLKRRAPGKDDPFKVAFCHQLQLFLSDNHFPLPHLIGTRAQNNSMLQWNGSAYELFEYIKGTNYDNSLEATADAGKTLALFHKLLAEYRPQYEPPLGSYHQSRTVGASMEALPQTLAKSTEEDQRVEDVDRIVTLTRDSYSGAARRVRELDFAGWPAQVIHSDWHPGNMLFHGRRVVAVIDYDAARVLQRIVDVANGALQFSITGGGANPREWPESLDTARLRRFIGGYESNPSGVLSRAEIRAIPWLMIEALIAESVIPIATTGSFARMDGVPFLQMVGRKVAWLQANAQDLVQLLEN